MWDNGIGIPEAQRKAIFEEFYQLDNPARNRHKGLGLGLAIVERTARLLGHTVEVRAGSGKGSLFAVVVPRVNAYPFSELNGLQLQAGDVPAARVLLIDDDPSVAMSLRLLLEVSGFRVISAPTGSEARKQLAQDAVQPDLVISDYRLPEGETGVQVVHSVKALLQRDIPAILLTGDTSPELIREIQHGSLEVLYKPVEGGKLIALIGYLLKERDSAGPDLPEAIVEPR